MKSNSGDVTCSPSDHVSERVHQTAEHLDHVGWGAAVTRSLTLAVQHGLGLEVEFRRVGFGRTRAQGVGSVGDGSGGHLAGLPEGLGAASHLLSLRLCCGLGARVGQLLGPGVGQLLRWRLGYGLGHRCRAL